MAIANGSQRAAKLLDWQNSGISQNNENTGDFKEILSGVSKNNVDHHHQKSLNKSPKR